MMDCRQLRDLLPLHAIDETRVEESLAVEEHVERCEACGEALAAYRRICETAGRVLAVVPGEPAPVSGSAGARRLESPRSRPGVGRWAPALALAAALLMAGVLVGRWTAVPAAGPTPSASALLSGRLALVPLREAIKAGTGASSRRRPTLSVFSRPTRSILTQAIRDGVTGDAGRSEAVRPSGGSGPGLDG
jgi:predicted anti-sigma-YlaC factor YlaD